MATSGDGVDLYFCDPCKNEGKSLEANGYCVNCREYLCERCFTYHTLPTLTKKHILLDNEQIKDKESVEIVDTCTERCPKHEREVIKYHCSQHSFLGCHLCFYLHQKTCKEVQYIPDVSQTITSTEEYQEFQVKLNSITAKSKELSKELERKVELAEICHTEAIAILKNFKTQLLDAIEKLEKEITQKAEKIKQDDTTKMNAIADKCKAVQVETDKITAELEALQNKQQNCDLYIAMMKAKESLLMLEDQLQTAENDKRSQPYKFKPNIELLEILKSPWGLGKLSATNTITKVEHLKDINVKSKDDTSTCRITGSALLLDSRLVLADANNKKVKLLDTTCSKFTSDLKLSSDPWGVAKVTDNQVAVALASEKKIVFVRTDLSLSVDREIGVNGQCRGVAYSEGKLVVSFDGPHKVEVMDLQGTVMSVIETDANGKQLFNYPYHVSINPENKLLYVPNYSSHNVVCLKYDGTVVATYTDSELSGPRQATIDGSGMVYVCGYNSHNVHQITEDCKKVKVLLTSDDGLNYPEAISYNETDAKLYIGQYSNDNVKVFQVSCETL